MSLHTLSGWLRCPICFRDLSARPPLVLACPSGHAFDANKRGYATLAASASKLQHDSASMLDAREAFLATGAYAPLCDTLAESVSERMPHRVIDIGCGTGYYLGAVLERLPDAQALAMDLSPAAVARAARRSDHVDGLVADVWSPLPIRDGAADVILNVFAPRNAAEFRRVLAPGGLLAVVVPGDDHLRELRERGLLIGVRKGKGQQLMQALGRDFALDEARDIRSTLTLSPTSIEALVAMGPSAHHRSDAPGALPPRLDVTASFRLFLLRQRADLPR
jgi:23S rRNA (guanine745-N1)-methyltransferase